jgi:hypothetical protein
MVGPRKPTEQEIQQLVAYEAQEMYEQPIADEIAEAKETIAGWIELAGVSVFDGYITDGPVYSGKVMVVVWPGSPTMTSTYIWEQESIIKVAGLRFNRQELAMIGYAFDYAIRHNPKYQVYQTIANKVQRLLNGEELA